MLVVQSYSKAGQLRKGMAKMFTTKIATLQINHAKTFQLLQKNTTEVGTVKLPVAVLAEKLRVVIYI